MALANLRGLTNAARLASCTLLWFLIAGLLAVTLGIVLGLVVNHGEGVSLDSGAAERPETVGGWTDFLTGIVPTDPIAAFQEVNVLQIVFLAALAGATTKMDGCAAIYPALAGIFVAEVFGVTLGVEDYLLTAFVSVVGSAATAGLTGATVMLTLTLSTLGLPLEGIGLLLAIAPILDMMRTATNVAGQALVPVLVARREGILDEAVHDGPSKPLGAPVGSRAAGATA